MRAGSASLDVVQLEIHTITDSAVVFIMKLQLLPPTERLNSSNRSRSGLPSDLTDETFLEFKDKNGSIYTILE